MKLIARRGSFGSEIRILDRDHREISEILVELNGRAARDENPGLQSRLLKELTGISRLHFALEEGMMFATGYSAVAAHKLRHRLMAEQIARLTAGWKCKYPAPRHWQAGLLWEAHVTHVENEDLSFGNWLNGVQPATSVDASRPARQPGLGAI